MRIDDATLRRISNTVRTLAMDAVQKAKSGHPGMPMGCADIAAVLWTKILLHNPDDSAWRNRDRFVLSAGHGSMLLYSMLHLSGYDVSLDDLKNFRQWGSCTPGHPEYGHTPGVETTTGPLGQGIANAVGMAIAERLLAEEFNAGDSVIDHSIYVLAGDGCLMEGISYEAASLAGHLGLGRIVVIYDSNSISIEGSTDLAFSDDVARRFEACRWHVQTIDGHEYSAIETALLNAKAETGRPSIIIAKTRIAKGSPGKEGSEESHGAPLGDDEVKNTKRNIGCDADSVFCVSDDVYEIFRQRKKELAAEYAAWNEKFARSITGETKKKWDAYFAAPDIHALREKLPVFDAAKPVATRTASGRVLEALFRELPNMAGGSADLAPSNKSFAKGFGETGRNTVGRNIHFGVREHAMGAIQNGMAYYGGMLPYTATFFVFFDYMRPPVRIAALSKLHVIYIFTHDSIFVGEDGPTHQPVEHLAVARAIPNLAVIRPADAEETKEAWLAALARTDGPTALVLTRQDMPVLMREFKSADGLHRGAYVLWEAADPKVCIMASGSEAHLALDAAKDLSSRGVGARVVSFPSWELFDAQSAEYKAAVLPASMQKRVVVETGVRMGWERYAGCDALFITMDNFGASAPANVLAEKFGFTKENIVARVLEFVKR